MPEHIHLPISEPQKKNPSTVMQALRLSFARAGPGAGETPPQPSLFDHAPQHIRQKRFYDFNVWTERKRIEELRYMHRNPVKRGLVASPELWRRSSFKLSHYLLAVQMAGVPLQSRNYNAGLFLTLTETTGVWKSARSGASSCFLGRRSKTNPRHSSSLKWSTRQATRDISRATKELVTFRVVKRLRCVEGLRCRLDNREL